MTDQQQQAKRKHKKRVEDIRVVYRNLVNAISNSQARGWAHQLGCLLNLDEWQPCTRCEGYGEHRKKEDCDCHDPHNCDHNDMVRCRKCSGLGAIITEREHKP